MKLIRYQGELSVSGTNVLMKLCLEKQRKIERVIAELPEGDGLFRSRIFNLLNRAWWAEWFKIQDCAAMAGDSPACNADAKRLTTHPAGIQSGPHKTSFPARPLGKSDLTGGY